MTLPPAERRAMEFLREHLPASDLDCYPFALFLEFAEHALLLRETADWCRTLDWELFCHYVLFPRVNDEDLSSHRRLFYEALWPRVAGLEPEEAALEVNRWCHELASYEMQDERTASPLTVYRCGSGRCGEESAFLVSALRSVGLPARQVYVPRWSHCDDNHAWVEVLCGGRWSFLGACEPEPVLDRGWFNAAAAQAVLVRSRLFGGGASPLHGELLSREGKVCWYNQTARYAPVRHCTFRALREGRPVPGAVFQLQVLNEAFFYTIATLTADEKGEASAALGLGSLHVLAQCGGWWAEGELAVDTLTLSLRPAETGSTPWRDFDFHPPQAPPPETAGLEPAQKQTRGLVLRRGSTLRRARIDGFFQPQWCGSPWEDLLRSARGNAGEIATFLEKDKDPRREKLLRTLTDKDLRDVSAMVLETHLEELPAQGTLQEEIYWPYVACPRVALEPLRPWRRALLAALTAEERENFCADPAALWAALEERVSVETNENYAPLFWTPAEALASGRCDEKSRKLLVVALLRSLGVPARLCPLDGAPEYWRDGAFRTLVPEATGVLSLRREEGPDWSLSRQSPEGWHLLSIPEGCHAVELPAGRYRLTCSVRLPAGDQLASMREIEIREGARSETSLRRRAYGLERLLYCREMPPVAARTAEGKVVPNAFAPGEAALLLWLEPGREPTEHLLHELAALGEEKRPRVLLGDPAEAKAVARRLNCDPEQKPLAVLLDKSGRARFALAGYRVGAAELLFGLAAVLDELDENKK